MGNIVLLDDLTINKIAAGEVIERPASVVKEMVENSIDAGARSITVEIKNGGISYIRISDNGKGIQKDDMDIAFERHATSKIRQADDLETVKSMGFRGEALASIAAISNVEMISKTESQETGCKIIVEGGKVLENTEIGCPTGTTITVTNLFYNTPVRYKFLKKDFTESGYIEDAVTRLALVNPNIAFKLINSGKTIIQTSGNGDIIGIIYSIYGKDVANGVLKVDYQYDDIHIKGVVGKPEIARSNRSYQMFFVNKRFVKDKTLSSATEKAFKGMLPIGRFAFLVLDIEMNSKDVDVNVHPAKLEVRFKEESKIFKSIYHAIQDVLLKQELVPNSKKEENNESNIVSETVETPKVEDTTNANNGGNTLTSLFRKITSMNKEQSELDTSEEKNAIQDIYQNRNMIKDEKESYEVEKNKQELKDKFDIEIKNKIEEMQKIINEQLSGASNQKDKKEETVKQEKAEPQSNLGEETAGAEKNNLEKDISVENTVEKDENNKSENELEEVKENKSEISEADKENLNEKVEPNNTINENKQEEEKKEISRENAENIGSIDLSKDLTKVQEGVLNDMLKKLQTKEDFTEEEVQDFEDMYEKTFGPKKNEAKEEENDALDVIKDNNISVFENIEKYNKPQYKFIGIAFSTYIILELDGKIYIIDQHAAHERIMYEKVKKNFYGDEGKGSQLLILPDVITLSHKEMDIAKDNMPLFKKAGFMLEEFGDNTIKLMGVPNICINLDTKQLFLETLDEINTVARTAKQEIEEKFIATIACKSAVKANMALTPMEVDNLMEELLKLPNPFTCPHGRPTAITMSKVDIEKKFARRK